MNIYRTIRTNLGFTQKKLAEIIGVQQPNISMYESGVKNPCNRVLLKLVKLCEKKGIKINNKKIKLETFLG